MRHDTDQQGWRYNLWFHTSRWAPHPGRLNWWGWVRRREWVRLRALLPAEPEPKEVEEEVHEPGTLDEVLKTERPVANMTRYLAGYALDREKLALWERWVAEGSAEARHTLADLFEDQEKVSAMQNWLTAARVHLARVHLPHRAQGLLREPGSGRHRREEGLHRVC